jgi:hypothetical protein
MGNEGDKRERISEDEILTGPPNAPTFVVTRYDESPVSRSSPQDETAPKTQVLLTPTGVPPTLNAPSRRRSLSVSPTLSLPPVDTVSPEINDVLARRLSRAPDLQHEEVSFPKPTRTNSTRVPVEPTPTAKRRRLAQRTPSAAQIDPWVLPYSICYVPYGQSQRHDKTVVDLVIVYMYRGGNNTNAHEKFFECPESGPEPNAHRGKAGALLAASGPDIELQLLQSASPIQPTKPSANGIAQEEPERTRNWLIDPSMLPEVMPHNRTICVGYDLETVGDLSSISYEQAALRLFQLLDERRKTCSTRPVIFIAHGLGCLVVQQAFQRRAKNLIAEALQKACAGILFHHVPVEESGSDGSKMDKIGPNITPATATFKPSSAPEQKSTKLDLTEIAREHSILHHVLEHGPSEKDHTQSFKFSTKNDITFQQLSAKIVEWSETHQLIRAVTQPDFAAVRRLIDEGVKINLRKTLSGETALHVACQSLSSRSQDINLLVRVGKADVTLRDSNGRTPLHHALRRELPDLEIVRVLLEAGAEILTPDCDRITPLDQARMTAPKRVRKLLRMRPLVQGPSAAKGSVAPAQPHSQSAGEVCDAYQMAATEMYFDGHTLTEKHLPRHFSIRDAIYGTKTLQRMLDDTRSNDITDDLVCRWYHLPANNMVWVEDLFRNRFLMHPTIWSEQVRDSEWPHGRCVIPHTAKFTAETGESVLAICVPYVSYEDNHRQRSVSETVISLVPSTQAKWHDISKNEFSQSPNSSGDTRRLSPEMLQQHNVTAPSTPKEHRPKPSNGPLSDGSGSDKANSAQSSGRGVPTYDPDDDTDADASDAGTSQVATSRLSKEEKNLVQVYLHHSPPLHMRRTLDQYYYYMLKDTRERDADQVVTRWAEKQLNRSHHNILMVDQLWIWVIEGKDGQPDRVVSCFPEREGHGSGFLDDLQRNVLHHNADKRQPITTSADLVARIVTTCSDIFGWSQEAELIRFLHFFEATVGRVGDVEIKLLNNFGKSSESLHHLDDNHFEYAKEKDKILIEMLDVREQVNLLTEAKDIRDEINIILHVLGEQQRVLEDDTITSFFGPNNNDTTDFDGKKAWKEPFRIIKRAIDDFKKMDKQMEDIVDGLNHLLDLQQKQATVWEARSTREGARATSKQGSVMVIFTMVTIIFLPLSFCASFFALDIAEFPADDKGQTNWPIDRLCSYLFGISFAVITPFIALAFATESALAAYYRFDKNWMIPFTIRLLNTLSWLPYMKNPCSKAVGGVIKRREEAYGAPSSSGAPLKPTPRLRSHSLASGILLLGFGRGGAAWPPNESACSGFDSEPPREQHDWMLARWMKERRERKGKPPDEDV